MSTCIHDAEARLLVQAALPVGLYGSTGESTAIDMLQTDGNVFVIEQIGSLDPATTVTAIIEEADTPGSWSAVQGVEFLSLGQSGVQIRMFSRNRRYIRYVYEIEGGEEEVHMGVLICAERKTV